MNNRRLRQAARSKTISPPPSPPKSATSTKETSFSKAKFQPFFEDASRLYEVIGESAYEGFFESSDEQLSPNGTHTIWEHNLIDAVNLVATLFAYREITCDHVHFTRNFKLGLSRDWEVLYDARAAVGNTDQPIPTPEIKETDSRSRLYWHMDTESQAIRFINEYDWKLDTTDAVEYLLETLALKGLSLDLESFFELLYITNRCKEPSLQGRRQHLLAVKNELQDLFGSAVDEGYASA